MIKYCRNFVFVLMSKYKHKSIKTANNINFIPRENKSWHRLWPISEVCTMTVHLVCSQHCIVFPQRTFPWLHNQLENNWKNFSWLWALPYQMGIYHVLLRNVLIEVKWKWKYRSGTFKSNTVKSKFYLVQFFLQNLWDILIILCLKCTVNSSMVNSKFHNKWF